MRSSSHTHTYSSRRGGVLSCRLSCRLSLLCLSATLLLLSSASLLRVHAEVSCGPGYYTQSNGDTGNPCIPCTVPPGWHCPNGAKGASGVICPEGYFCAGGTAEPVRCNTPPGSWCPAGSTSIEGSLCEVGTWCPGGELSSRPCTAAKGKFCALGSAHTEGVLCPRGQRCPKGGSDGPTPCSADFAAPGRYCAEGTIDTAVICPAGKACAGADAIPEDCTEGHYCPAGSSDSRAVRCAAGRFCPAGSSTQGAACTLLNTPPGRYCPEATGADGGDPCPAGSYCAGATAAAVACPERSNSAEGSAQCKCNAGHKSSTTTGLIRVGGTCSQCPAGTYAEEGSADCIPCGSVAGFYCDVAEPTRSGRACPPGKFCLGGVALPSACVAAGGKHCPDGTNDPAGQICEAGTYCRGGSYAKQMCPVSHQTSAAGSASLIDCICRPGHSGPDGATEEGSCVECPPGVHCPGGAARIRCEGTTYTEDSTLPCQACGGGGKFVNAPHSSCGWCVAQPGRVCREGDLDSGSDCLPNHYCPGGELPESVCPDGSSAPAGQRACKCDAGRQSSTADGLVSAPTDECRVCPSGTYSSQPASAYCTPCPLPQQTSVFGATSVSQCTCAEGFVGMDGATTAGGCALCAPGHYCAGGTSSVACTGNEWTPNGQTECASCPAGLFPSEDHSSCEVCQAAAGSACAVGDDVTGHPCAAGHYCPGGTAPESECPSYSHSSAGQSVCLCDVGTSNGGTAGFQHCAPCAAGTYQSLAGQSSCITCTKPPVLAGFYCPAGGSSSSGSPCPLTSTCAGGSAPPVSFCEAPPGLYCASDESDRSGSGCEANYFCEGGQVPRQACPPHSTSPPLSTSRSACICDAGYFGTGGVSCSACTMGVTTPGRFCPVNTAQDGGQTCPAGYSCAGGKAQPVLCPAGYVCPAGTGSPLASSTVCPVGHFCAAGSSGPTPCTLSGAPAGTYCPPHSTTNHGVQCPANMYCAGGSAEPIACNIVGHYCPVGSTTNGQELCPAGSFCPGNTAPSPCTLSFSTTSAGRYCPAGTGADRGELCPAGSWCAGGSNPPQPCAAGYYCPQGSSNPRQIDCPVGSFCPEGSSEPTPCTIEAGTGPGKVCPRNSATDGGATCPMNKYCTGASAPDVTCSVPGSYCPTGSQVNGQVLCPAGNWCGNGGAAQPVPCVSDGEGTTEPGRYCPAGTTDPAGSLCPAGSWCAGGQAEPLPCSAGYYCEAGSSSATEFVCPAGSFCAEGCSAPSPCTVAGGTTPGRFCAAYSGADGGEPCLAHHWCAGGSADAEPCPLHSDSTTGQATCACDVGYKSSTSTGRIVTGQTCSACLAGTYAVAASANCTLCGAGTYQSSSAQGSCLLCTLVNVGPGRYCPKGGSSINGTVCPWDSVCSGGSAAPVRVCQAAAGSYCASGTVVVTSCPANSWCAGLGALPVACGAHSTSPPGSDAASDCKCSAGYFSAAAGSPPCTKCSVDSYCPSIGTITPTPCPPGSSTNGAVGVASLAGCAFGDELVQTTLKAFNSQNAPASLDTLIGDAVTELTSFPSPSHPGQTLSVVHSFRTPGTINSSGRRLLQTAQAVTAGGENDAEVTDVAITFHPASSSDGSAYTAAEKLRNELATNPDYDFGVRPDTVSTNAAGASQSNLNSKGGKSWQLHILMPILLILGVAIIVIIAVLLIRRRNAQRRKDHEAGGVAPAPDAGMKQASVDGPQQLETSQVSNAEDLEDGSVPAMLAAAVQSPVGGGRSRNSWKRASQDMQTPGAQTPAAQQRRGDQHDEETSEQGIHLRFNGDDALCVDAEEADQIHAAAAALHNVPSVRRTPVVETPKRTPGTVFSPAAAPRSTTAASARARLSALGLCAPAEALHRDEDLAQEADTEQKAHLQYLTSPRTRDLLPGSGATSRRTPMAQSQSQSVDEASAGTGPSPRSRSGPQSAGAPKISILPTATP